MTLSWEKYLAWIVTVIGLVSWFSLSGIFTAFFRSYSKLCFSIIEVWLENKNCMYYIIQCFLKKCTIWWLNGHIHCETITTIKLINIFITSHGYPVCVWLGGGEHLRATLNKFQVNNIVLLTTVIRLHIRAFIIYLVTKFISLNSLTHFSPFLWPPILVLWFRLF